MKSIVGSIAPLINSSILRTERECYALLAYLEELHKITYKIPICFLEDEAEDTIEMSMFRASAVVSADLSKLKQFIKEKMKLYNDVEFEQWKENCANIFMKKVEEHE